MADTEGSKTILVRTCGHVVGVTVAINSRAFWSAFEHEISW